MYIEENNRFNSFFLFWIVQLRKEHTLFRSKKQKETITYHDLWQLLLCIKLIYANYDETNWKSWHLQPLYQVYPQCLSKKFKFSERFFEPLISRERSSVKVWYFDRRVHALISLRIHHLNPWFSDAFMGRGIKCGDNL